jgi:uncharacterized protein YecE (DUF72 family)
MASSWSVPRYGSMAITIGTAGWSIGRDDAPHFDSEGSALERYAGRFNGVEINSSFYRPHRPSTWARWAQSVPQDFRFSVKVPKTISHERRLVGCDDLVQAFLDQTMLLGDKLAILLLQLPPSLAFHAATVEDFLSPIVAATPARIVCEPRHASWFEGEADRLLAARGVARAAADPARVPSAAMPGGWRGLAYWRLHGSPDMYRSAYDPERLDRYAQALALPDQDEAWCIFDNTAAGAATGDALALQDRLVNSGA